MDLLRPIIGLNLKQIIKMIKLFNINNYKINMSEHSNVLHGNIVSDLESSISSFVGAKYAVSLNSATNAIFLSLLGKNTIIDVPSMIPPVVLNAIHTSGNKYNFIDNTDWVGDSYILHDFGDYKIVDSAQKIVRNQFKTECNDEDLMIFSFYPTKPIGSCDGGMIVSNDYLKIEKIREMALNGMSFSINNWERKINSIGYKMYMNSIQADIAMKNFLVYEKKLKKLNEIKKFYNKKLNYNNTSDHLYRILVDDRDSFMKHMNSNGIQCGIHYDPMHLHQVYSLPNSVCPNSEIISKKTVSIPFHEKLTKKELNHIVTKIKNFI
jgi:dTDP-4-amino-4,6-dideoxygalactose transaminase